jgi:hypothetical protein
MHFLLCLILLLAVRILSECLLIAFSMSCARLAASLPDYPAPLSSYEPALKAIVIPKPDLAQTHS